MTFSAAQSQAGVAGFTLLPPALFIEGTPSYAVCPLQTVVSRRGHADVRSGQRPLSPPGPHDRKGIRLDFTALEHREATRFLADEKTKGLTAEQVFSHASVLMIRAIKSTEPESASLARFFAAACVIAAREVNNFGTDMNCLSADEDPSGQQIARYFMCGYADPIEVIRTELRQVARDVGGAVAHQEGGELLGGGARSPG